MRHTFPGHRPNPCLATGLPVVLYFTLPAINFHQNTTHESVKHQKRKQRDFQRMKEFNEQKTVCATFPFYSLENEDFKIW